MEEATPAAPSNREMLAHLSALAAPALALVQLGVMLFARWERVEFFGWRGHIYFEYTLSPWIPWMPFFEVVLCVMAWYGMRRKLGRAHKLALILSLVITVGIAAVGLSLDPPPSRNRPDINDSPILPERNFPTFPNY